MENFTEGVSSSILNRAQDAKRMIAPTRKYRIGHFALTQGLLKQKLPQRSLVGTRRVIKTSCASPDRDLRGKNFCSSERLPYRSGIGRIESPERVRSSE